MQGILRRDAGKCASTGQECLTIYVRYHVGDRDRTFKTLAAEEIDLYAEYTGTLLMNFPGIKHNLSLEETHGKESLTAAGLNAKFLSKRMCAVSNCWSALRWIVLAS